MRNKKKLYLCGVSRKQIDMEKNKKKKYEKPSMKVVKLAQKRQALLNGTRGDRSGEGW